MKVTAIILSAGKGKRMNSAISKQYLIINDKPLIYYTLRAFEASIVDDVVIVAGKDDIEYIRSEITEKYGFNKVRNIVSGGKERYHSSYNGILAADDSDYVLIHDAARPCITPGKINDLVEYVKKYKACILGVPVKDTIKISDGDGKVLNTPDRSKLWQIQTPQGFEREKILAAYNNMIMEEDYSITDDSMVIEKYSDIKVHIIDGEYTNIKVTTQEDMRIVNDLIK